MPWTDVRWTGSEPQATLRVLDAFHMGIVWTLRARGLVPSLGAGGSLVVAALCCLLLASAVISFRDWPGSGGTTTEGTIAMPAPAAKASGRAAAGPSAPAAAVAVAAPPADR